MNLALVDQGEILTHLNIMSRFTYENRVHMLREVFPFMHVGRNR